MTASVVQGQRAQRRAGPIHGSSDRRQDRQLQRSPSPKMIPHRCAGTCNRLIGYLYLLRGSERSATPMPEDRLRSPLKELIPIDSSAGPSQDTLGTNPPVLRYYMLSTWWFHVQSTNTFLNQNMLSSFRIH
jgi:hypothetical protein